MKARGWIATGLLLPLLYVGLVWQPPVATPEDAPQAIPVEPARTEVPALPAAPAQPVVAPAQGQPQVPEAPQLAPPAPGQTPNPAAPLPTVPVTGQLVPSEPSAPAEAERVAATLLLVRSSWSDIENKEEVERELTALLAGDPLPDSYRQNLLASAPKILFSDQFVSLYDPQELASLITWLTARGLARPAAVSAAKEYPDLTGMFVGTDVVDIRDVGFQSDEPAPFVTRIDRWVLRFGLRPGGFAERSPETMDVIVSRAVQRLDQVQVGGTGVTVVEERDLVPTHSFRFQLPRDRAAAISGPIFTLLRGSSSRPWEPVLIVVPESSPLPEGAEPKLAKPASLTKLTSFGGSLMRRESSSRSRLSARATEPPPAAATSAAPTAAATAPAETTTRDTGRQMRVFLLQYAQPTMVLELVRQVIGDIAMGADPRTNSLIVSGTEADLATIEALVARLDVPAPAVPAMAPQAAMATAEPQLLESQRAEYQRKEQQAAALAESLRRGGLEEQQAGRTKERLRNLIAEVFDLRQQLHEMELKLLGERMQALEARLRQRAALRDQIIAKRLEQLATLPPSADSFHPASGYSPQLPMTAPPAGMMMPGSPAGPSPGVAIPAAAAYPAMSGALRTPEQFVDARRRANSQAQRQAVELEFAAQVRLIELELASQKAAFARLQERVDGGLAFRAQGLPDEGLPKAQADLQQAAIRLEQLQTLLDLYRKVGEASGLLKPAVGTPAARGGAPPAEDSPPGTNTP